MNTADPVQSWCLESTGSRPLDMFLPVPCKVKPLYPCEHMLLQVPILFPLSDRQLWQLARALIPEKFAKGETVFGQGDSADKFYICSKGAFSCFTSEWLQGLSEGSASIDAGCGATGSVIWVVDQHK